MGEVDNIYYLMHLHRIVSSGKVVTAELVPDDCARVFLAPIGDLEEPFNRL
jgi:hypothetical protein